MRHGGKHDRSFGRGPSAGQAKAAARKLALKSSKARADQEEAAGLGITVDQLHAQRASAAAQFLGSGRPNITTVAGHHSAPQDARHREVHRAGADW